jgi:hypothetical protein
MTGRTRRDDITFGHRYMFTDGHARLANVRVEAMKLVLTGSDLRKVAEAIAPKWAGRSFEMKTEEQKEQLVRYIYKDIRDKLKAMSDEEKQRMLQS